MFKFLLITLAVLSNFAGLAQTGKTHLVFVADTSFVPKDKQQPCKLSNISVSQRYAALKITGFEPAFPKSNYWFFRQYYYVTGEDSSFLSALNSEFPARRT